MAEWFLPVLSHFQNKNPWTASAGRLRYRVLPVFPEEGEPSLAAEVWEGPWSYEYSVPEAARSFPLSEAGLAALPGWLEEWRTAIESRPERTMAENVQRRAASAKAQEEAKEKELHMKK